MTSTLQSLKSVLLITIIFYGLIKLFILPSVSDFEFSISRNQVKYHSNWTESFSKLKHLPDLHEALKLPSITDLDISLSMSSGLTLDDIAHIFPHQFRPYTSLKLNLGSIKLGTKGAEYVMSLIPNGVENLELYFDSIGADNGLAKSIANKLNELTSLKKAKVSLILSSIKDEGFASFFETHRIHKNLKNLRLVFIGNQLNQTAFKGFGSYLKGSELEVFGLNLYANNIGAEGAKSISEGVSQVKFRDLDIDLYFNNITEVGTKDLCDSLATLQSLEKLSLNFDFNYIKNEGAKQIGQLLKKLPQLAELHIGVASKNFGYLGFKSLIDGMSAQKKLKSLTLRCGVNRVGINGASIVNKMLQGMPQLETLNLGFVQNYIGDEGLKEISETVATKLPNLKNVDLDLGFNDAKGYGGISALKSFSSKSWNNLDLRLSHNEFRDTDIKLMRTHLKDILKKTKSFVFQFMDTAVSKVMMADLQKLFEKYGNDNTKIYINSIIPEEEQQEAKVNEEKPEKKVQSEQKQKPKVQKVKSEEFDKNKKEAEAKKKEELQKKQKQEAEAKKKQETERKEKEETERKHKEETQRKQREETERKHREQAEKKQKEEKQKKQKEEAERKEKEEAERAHREEEERKSKEEAEAKAREEERKQKEQAERKLKEETERKQKEETERKAKEEDEKKARQEAEKKEREHIEKKKAEEAQRKQREEAERKSKQEAERRQKEEAQKKLKAQAEAEAEAKHKEESQKKQKEEAPKQKKAKKHKPKAESVENEQM